MPEYQPQAINYKGLSPMVRAYLECAEWCGIDDEQREAFEGSVASWSDSAIAQATQDCEGFLADIGADADAMTPERLGIDFWLTRNRHGAGFWDRGLGAVGQRLTDAANAYGEAYVLFDEETGTLDLA